MRRSLLALLLVGACSQPAPAASSPPPSPSAPAPSATPGCSERALAGLDEAGRAGQLLWVGLRDNQVGPEESAAIRDLHAGGVWFTELSDAPASQVKSVADAAQALAAGGPRLLVAANQEGGRIDQFHGPGFSPIPAAAVQGAEDPAQLRADAARWGRELKAAGINLEVAPVMDTVPPGEDQRNQPIGALQRGFGHDPRTVADHGVAFLQGMHDAGLAVTIKHFPGLGRVAGNTDFAAAVVDDQTTVDDPYLEPFQAGMAAGADLVMVSTATYSRIDPGHLAAFSSQVVSGLLRGRLGFSGVVAADDLGAAAAVQSVPPGQRAVDFVAAGGDLIDTKYAGLAPAMEQALLERAAGDAAFRAQVDQAALRVLKLKERYGLLAC